MARRPGRASLAWGELKLAEAYPTKTPDLLAWGKLQLACQATARPAPAATKGDEARPAMFFKPSRCLSPDSAGSCEYLGCIPRYRIGYNGISSGGGSSRVAAEPQS